LNQLGSFQISTKILGDIHNFVIITGVNNTGDKLFIGVNINGDVLLLMIIYDIRDETVATISACPHLKVNLE
jgi:hypothetical protein